MCLEEVIHISSYLFVRRRDVDGFTAKELYPACPSFLFVIIVLLDDLRDVSNRDKNASAINNGNLI